MGKYFGTDGIRGVANVELTPDLAYRTGFALGCQLYGDLQRKPRVLIGRDTRISGTMLEAALTAGLCAAGSDVVSLGVLPTPAVARATVADDKADAGIVISASHNPYEHNGIKIFGGDGYKLTDAQEAAIEAAIDAPPAQQAKTFGEIGCLLPCSSDPAADYCSFVASTVPEGLQGMRVLVDCANGSASATAKEIFARLGAVADFLSCEPDGVNINVDCGSTHLKALQQGVVAGGYPVGVAFDGDADRCLVVDERGEVIDGDHLIGILAADMKQKGTLKHGAVGTILSNLGLHSYLKERGISIATANVGDRYVLEKMRAEGHNIGGEQSGHVILSDYATTGDGEMTAVHFLRVLRSSGKTASALAGEIETFPQSTINVDVPNKLKHQVADMDCVHAIREKIAGIFGEDGRVIIRPSGTEPKVRVMVEGRDADAVKAMAKEAADVIAAAVQQL